MADQQPPEFYPKDGVSLNPQQIQDNLSLRKFSANIDERRKEILDIAHAWKQPVTSLSLTIHPDVANADFLSPEKISIVKPEIAAIETLTNIVKPGTDESLYLSLLLLKNPFPSQVDDFLHQLYQIRLNYLVQKNGIKLENLDSWVKHNKQRLLDNLYSQYQANNQDFLRTYIAEITGYLGTLDESIVKLQQSQALTSGVNIPSVLARASRRLREILHDSLVLIELDGCQTQFEQVDMVNLLQKQQEQVADDLKKRNLQLQTNMAEEGGLSLITDPSYVRLIVDNLLGNAIKYSKKGGGKISISMVVQEINGQKSLRISFQDDGIGMDTETLRRVREFRREYRGIGANSHAEGTGLGLALSAKLAEKLGGHIEVDSDGEGQGSTFTLVLPLK
jgi:signal transduction histidine kinase